MQAVIVRKNYPRQTQTFMALTLVILVGSAVYGYSQYQNLSAAQTALRDGQTKITELQSTSAQLSENYTALTATYNETFQGVRQAIDSVYPTEEQYTKLTQDLDDFVNKNNTRFNPIFMSDLKFSKSRIDKETEYAILPFSLTLQTTKENFEKFLQYVENSGSLDEGTRLIEVRAISINFAGNQQSVFAAAEDGQQIEIISVSVSLNAYFQPSSEELAKTKPAPKKK